MIMGLSLNQGLILLPSYLPAFPYQDDPVLHIYAGMASLYLAQPSTEISLWDTNRLRDARTHFEHAVALDAANPIAEAFLAKVRMF
jgi:RNA polymerase I-specific transcription initiation factor RRN11